MFLHIGLLHLGMNMLALWTLSQVVERMFGHTGFFLLYLFSGLAGSIASVVWNPNVVSAGASGAIFGVAGGLLAGAWKLRRSLPRFFLRSAWWLAVNVLVLLVVYAVINYFYPLIDNAAHVAGLISGGLMGLILAEPLPNPGRSRKKLRNSIVAVLGTAALAAGIAPLANPPADVVKLELEYKRVETQVVRMLDSAEERRQARAITPEEYAGILENDVLPRWRALHQSFNEAGHIPDPNQEYMADLLKIIELREAGWQLLIEAIRENDKQKQQESEELLDEASEIINRLNQQPEEN
jgi:rhomboid protease GluP